MAYQIHDVANGDVIQAQTTIEQDTQIAANESAIGQLQTTVQAIQQDMPDTTQIESDMSALQTSVSGLTTTVNGINMTLGTKMNEPTNEGTNGQVLTTDGNGNRTWTTVQGGGGSSVEIDDTLTQQGEAADAKAAGDALATKLTKPATDGTNGQVLTADGNGGAAWAAVSVDDTTVETAVGSYINAHPEVIAVADGSITEAKLAPAVAEEVNKIGEIYDSVINEKILSAGVLEQGTLSDSAGTESSSTNTVRSGFVSSEALTIKMVVKDGWKVKTPYYASPSSFTQTTTYKTGTDVIQLNDTDKKLFRIAIRKVDNTDFTPADVPEDVVTLSYNTNTVTEMADDVAGVKDTFVNDSVVEDVIYGGRYNQGTLNETTGANISSNYFIRSSRLTLEKYYNSLYPILHIEPAEGYVLGIFIYPFVDNTRTFAYGINGIDAPYDYEMKEPIDIRVAVSKADGSTISNYQENTQNLFTLTFKRNKADIANFETENFLKNEQFVRIVNNVNNSSCLYDQLNIVSGNGYIDPATGEAQVFSTANKLSTTKMIDISKYGVLYYKKAGYTNNPGGMAFYDADGVYISGEPAIKGIEQYNIKVLNDVTYDILGVVKVPKNAVYARFTILTGESKGEFHLYGTYRHMSEYNNSKYGITTKRNNQEKVTEFLNIAKTYLPTGNSYLPEGHSGQNTLGYGYGTILSSATPLQTVTDKWDIDCSTFVGLALRGYTYEETSYPTQNWVDPSTWVANPNVEWAINPFDWIYPVNADWVMEAEEDRAYNNVRTAAAMCQWMVERGWEVPIDPKLANLEPGDIIFYSRHNSADNDYVDPERYKLINHVAICMTKEAPPSSNWDAEKYPYRHRLIDVRTRSGACGTDVVETAWNDPTAIYSNNVNTIACICRPDFR